MANIIIRNLEPVVIQKIEELAKKKNLSREEYLRRYLTKLSELEDVIRLDEKYAKLSTCIAVDFAPSPVIAQSKERIKERIHYYSTGVRF